MFDMLWQEIVNHFSGALSSFEEWFQLAEWWVIGLAIIVLCIIVGWFFSVVRPYAGVVALTVIGFLTGATKMHSADKAHEKKRK
jgi:hypothetical protein